MKSLAWVRQQVIDWIEDDSDRAIIDRAINTSIETVTSMCPFSQLSTQVTVTPDENGIITLPPRCQDIVDIYPSSEIQGADFVFKGAKRVQTYGNKAGYYFRSVGVVEEPLNTLVCDFTKDSATVTQNDSSAEDFSADMIGQEFIIAGGNESYRVDGFSDEGTQNTLTVYPKYRWASYAGLECYIRPEGKEQVRLYDSQGTVYQGEVIVEYRQYHPQLVQDKDILLIPAYNTVALETVRFFLRQTKYDVDADRLERQYLMYKESECSKQPAKNDSNFRTNDRLFQPRSRTTSRR